ncbi:MAG: L-rhamnose mutarotase [Cardiobacteriaceae bacterium]|nr:L-rhamnose mutarotase [Cardiobacteriaceae bacterium]
MQQFVLLLDLKDDEALIAEYERWHQKIWAEVYEHLRAAGIVEMKIHRFQNRLVMFVKADADFTWEKLNYMAEQNPKIQEWEALMDTYQKRFEGVEGKWQLASEIFDLERNH